MNQKKPQQNSFLKMLGSKFKEKLAELIANKIISLLVIVLTAILSSSGTYYTIPDFDFNFDFFTLVGISILVGIVTTVFIVWFIKFLLKTLEQADDPVIICARRKVINRFVDKIKTGQSAAIIGACGQEKALILTYINDNRKMLFADQNDRLIFHRLNISTLGKKCQPAEFWERALESIQEKFSQDKESAIFKAYEFCRERNFETHYLERLIIQLRKDNWRLVLLLDQFEALLHFDYLKSSEFLSGLKVLSTLWSPSSLILIITTNLPLWKIHEETKELNPYASPFLGFFEAGAVRLGAIPEQEIDQLLKESRYSFTNDENRFLKDVSGGHPCLLENAVVTLKRIHKDISSEGYSSFLLKKIFGRNKKENSLETAKAKFKDEFTDFCDALLTNTLSLWPPKLREALVSVGQGRDLSDFKRIVIRELENQGFIQENNGNWQVRSCIFADLLKERE